MPYRLRTRFAPTPSGYLHLGNAWSFVLTWLAARSQGGTVRLRIDDLDGARFREEYLDDIFESLHWLGLDWDAGPRDAADFKAAHSQRLRTARYEAAVEALRAGGRTYACACSREQLKLAGEGPVYPGTCRELGLEGSGNALRYRMPGGSARARDPEGGAFELHPARDLGDFVLRRRDGAPSYQIASLADDEDAGINFIVRGLDLLPSTGAQLSLAASLGLEGFPQARFWHHALLLDDAGHKLSKSQGAESLRVLRARLDSPAPVYRFFAAALGGPADAATARDLLPAFHWSRVTTEPLRLPDFLRRLGD
jgi:glutamyl/glutaminyl-tRNA synthetase